MGVFPRAGCKTRFDSKRSPEESALGLVSANGLPARRGRGPSKDTLGVSSQQRQAGFG